MTPNHPELNVESTTGTDMPTFAGSCFLLGQHPPVLTAKCKPIDPLIPTRTAPHTGINTNPNDESNSAPSWKESNHRNACHGRAQETWRNVVVSIINNHHQRKNGPKYGHVKMNIDIDIISKSIDIQTNTITTYNIATGAIASTASTTSTT